MRPFLHAAVIGASCVVSYAQSSGPAGAAVEQPEAAAIAAPPALLARPITLEQIMADPDWIGNEPEGWYWADDGKSFYYSVKRVGSEARDLIQMDLNGAVLRTVSDAEKSEVDVPGGDYSRDFTRKVYSRAGDLYVKDVVSGTIRQLTRTVESEDSARFMPDGRIVFRRGGATLIRDLATGFEFQPADLRAADDPDVKKDEKGDYLREQQERLFDFIRERKAKEEESKARQKAEREADGARAPLPWYLGGDVEIRGSDLSPTGEWMLVRLVKKGTPEAKADSMPQYVSPSGYVESRSVRSKVGTGKAVGERLVLLNLGARTRHDLDLSVLPGIADDPLAEVRKAAEAKRKAEEGPIAPADPGAPPATPQEMKPDETKPDEGKPKDATPRPVRIGDIQWSDDGSRVVVQAYSLDNKDRWIASVDLAGGKLVPLERDTDEAWINGRFTRLGWQRDTATIWFLSERSGYSHLYTRDLAGEEGARALTRGSFEVSSVRSSRDGKALYYTANVHHPGEHEAWRVDVATGTATQLTDFKGGASFSVSPDESNLLVLASSITRPPELYLQAARGGGSARRMTGTVSEAFVSYPWVVPEVAAIPSSHGAGPIYSRVYAPAEGPGLEGTGRPAVVFIHGAGYLQNAHKGWSSYFREFMFHTLLVERGYVVLDMDYRASAGYGRDWRTAIYRRMGTPELEDLADGVAWLAANRGVDPARVGVYGGSYGGFLTLMALFREPDLFACGAALRPVTDWAHYNHGYTSDILNTPTEDPEAYLASSPIEFAAGLSRPLLICHGMQDDNVFFQDTVRLAQRLIELGKDGWEVAAYPVEAHGFVRPSSWRDEYARILRLFEGTLRP